MSELTPRQAEILAFIRAYIAKHEMPPTQAEIGTHFGFTSPNSVPNHLSAMSRKGVIQLLPRTARGIKITVAL